MVRRNNAFQRSPWEDRFERPTLTMLRGGLARPEASLFDRACTELARLFDRSGEIRWNGECWKWTVVFDRGRRGDAGPLAVVIPNPAELQVAATFAPEFLRQVQRLRLRRAVRDGLELAADPFDSDWCVWPISARTVLDEVLGLIRRKREFHLRAQSQ